MLPPPLLETTAMGAMLADGPIESFEGLSSMVAAGLMLSLEDLFAEKSPSSFFSMYTVHSNHGLFSIGFQSRPLTFELDHCEIREPGPIASIRCGNLE